MNLRRTLVKLSALLITLWLSVMLASLVMLGGRVYLTTNHGVALAVGHHKGTRVVMVEPWHVTYVNCSKEDC